jgi:hypothetical protein
VRIALTVAEVTNTNAAGTQNFTRYASPLGRSPSLP